MKTRRFPFYRRMLVLLSTAAVFSLLTIAFMYSVVTYTDVATFNADPRVNKPVSYWQWLLPVRDNQ